MDLDGWSPCMFPVEPHVHPHFLYNIGSFVDNSFNHSRYFYISGSLALQDAFNCMSKYTGSLLLRLASRSHFNVNGHSPGKNLGSNTVSSITYTQVKHIASAGPSFSQLGPTFRIKGESLIPVIFDKFSNCTGVQLCRQAGRLQSFPMLLLASALIPPLDKVSITSHDVTSVQLVNGNVHMQSCMDQSPCEVEHRECGDPCFTEKFSCSRHAVEPLTGIEFPTVLDNILARETNSNWPSEVNIQNLHGSCWTGSRTIKVIKIKSQKVYAFGFYIHPSDVYKKLGPKYACIRAGELDKHHNFYRDLLREDISMTVRLVVSVNGMKISAVRNAFEKSLRARLMKTNPATDFDCLRKFSSLFSQDAPIRAGTTIYFRRTVDGHLITESKSLLLASGTNSRWSSNY